MSWSLYQHTFGLLVATRIGLAISLLCLVLCILTFKFCRSIQGTRTTIHLHLCICLFFADLFFLAGIEQTSPVVRACTRTPWLPISTLALEGFMTALPKVRALSFQTLKSWFGQSHQKVQVPAVYLTQKTSSCWWFPHRAAAGLWQWCSISSSWPSLCGCFWKESSCTVWWFRSSMPQSGLSTCLWLVMGFLWLSSSYRSAWEQQDTAQSNSRLTILMFHQCVTHSWCKGEPVVHRTSFFLTSCWLSLNDGLIWSFFGPVCLIIILNAFFFIITVWKLAQKFTSLNPDLSSLHKIRSVSFFLS